MKKVKNESTIIELHKLLSEIMDTEYNEEFITMLENDCETLIDSLSFIRFLVAAEDRYSITFPDELLGMECDFLSDIIKEMAKIIDGKKA